MNFTSPVNKTSVLWLTAVAVILAGCGGDRTRPEPTVIEAPADGINPQADAGVIVQGIDPESQIQSELIDSEDAWELSALADQASGEEAIVLRLAAIEKFIALQEFPAAETQTNFLIGVILDANQTARLSLYRGQIASALGQHELALSYLQPLRGNAALTNTDRLAMFNALANAQVAMDRPVDALVSLLNSDLIMVAEVDLSAGQLETQRRILSLMDRLNPVEQSLLEESAVRSGLPPNLVPGWFAFLPLRNMSEQQRRIPLTRWANAYATHPARGELLGDQQPLTSLTLQRFNHIGLLLPLTSPFGNAAQAFYDGFIDSYNNDDSLYKPAVSLHDIGEDAELVSFYYQSAINEGADFIVGPLGRSSVTGLLRAQPLPLPTLVLGDIDPEQGSNNLYGISLSPELEAEQVAQRAFDSGHRQAGVFRSDSEWGGRAASAFNKKWLELGGIIVTNKSFPSTIDDYSRIIQNLLEVNKSVARERVLSAQLGVNLEFTPRRRDDMDMLFFAGDAKQARLLVPQMRFFQAHDLPIYATSNIFTGKTNPAVDADLDEIIFGDMGWMLQFRYPVAEELTTTPESTDIATEETTETTAPSKLQPVPKSPYSFSPLDRLYALGRESYHLIPRLSSLRQDHRQRYNGDAFAASVRTDGNIIRYLDWATFDNGNISLLNPPVVAPTQSIDGQTQ